jgi:drug/metabolite transporter (DMT)-like permease
LVGHFSVTWSLRWVPANIPPVIMLAIPVLAGVLAWILLGQATTPVKVAGGLLTLLGVAGAVRSAGRDTLAGQALDLAEET